MSTLTITEFLEARIAEDEARARDATRWAAVGGVPWIGEAGDGLMPRLGEGGPHIKAWSPARVLAECAAKRAIIELHGLMDDRWLKDYCETCAVWWDAEVGEGPPAVKYPCPTQKALAAVYADHADYRQEWKL